MPNYIGRVDYRLAGNLFANQYRIDAGSTDAARVALAEILAAMSYIQTPDVEYVNAMVTEAQAPYTTSPLELGVIRNGAAGGPTLPSGAFLVFTFHAISRRGRTSTRIRGASSNDFTDLGTFNASSGGDGDLDGADTVSAELGSYRSFIEVVERNSRDQNYQPVVGSSKISIGYKRATRRL